ISTKSCATRAALRNYSPNLTAAITCTPMTQATSPAAMRFNLPCSTTSCKSKAVRKEVDDGSFAGPSGTYGKCPFWAHERCLQSWLVADFRDIQVELYPRRCIQEIFLLRSNREKTLQPAALW